MLTFAPLLRHFVTAWWMLSDLWWSVTLPCRQHMTIVTLKVHFIYGQLYQRISDTIGGQTFWNVDDKKLIVVVECKGKGQRTYKEVVWKMVDNYGMAAMSCQKQLKFVVERKGDSKICKETGNDHQRQNLSFWKRYYGLVVLKYFTISLSVLPT